MTFLLKNAFSAFTNTLLKVSNVPKAIISPLVVPDRTKWIDNRMARDVKRRQTLKEFGKERLQINAIRKNTILPKKIREIADKEVRELPLDSCIARIHARCVLTSRPRGRWKKYRMSRIIWRHLADYNQISGVERAMWSFTP